MQKILKRTIAYLFAALTMLALTGCGLISLDDFTLLEARISHLEGLSKATVELTVENRSCFKVKVTSGELTAYYKGEPLATMELRNEIVLPRRSTSTVDVEVAIRFASPIAALRAVKVIDRDPESITVSGYGEGRIWFFKKRMERQNVPISKFIDIFGAPSTYL